MRLHAWGRGLLCAARLLTLACGRALATRSRAVVVAVQDLAARMQNDPAQLQLDKLKNEYAAYKSYSADLLEKEKAMNKRLRNLNFN